MSPKKQQKDTNTQQLKKMKDQIMEALRREIVNRMTISKLCADLAINRAAFTRALKEGGISFNRFFEVLRHLEISPAVFFATLENKQVLDKTHLEMFYELEAARLKIERLQQRISELEGGK